MSHEIRPDYESQLLFPQSVEDWIEADHPARYVREFVDALDVSQLGLSEEQEARRHETHGRPHYAVDMLLKLWLYAYMNRIQSSRALERGCRDLLPLIWLAGRHVPDHNTLWRFWNRYRATIKQLFLQSVRVAIQQNLVGMALHALDGTKIRSAASKRTAWHRADLKKRLAQLASEIEALETQIAAEGEDDEEGPDDRLPKELQKREALRTRIQKSLAELEQAECEHLHPLDPEARVMVSGNGRTSFAYNAQANVDETNGVIVSEDVNTEANDQHQLVPMLEQTKENVGQYAEITVTDSGYHAAEALGEAEAKGAHVLVAIKQKDEELGPYHTSRFTYDASTDSVQCPQGQTLPREGVRKHRKKPYPVQTYRCKVFASCPVASACSRDRDGRSIEISPHHEAVARNRRHPDARALLIRRQSVVERAFAEIKEVLGLRRWSFRGLAKVQAQWSMTCAAMNLRRMIAATR